MDIHEVHEMKHLMEKNILNEIRKFEKETGLIVCGFEISRVRRISISRITEVEEIFARVEFL